MQIVMAEIQRAEVAQPAQRRGNPADQSIQLEVQVFKAGELAQLHRNLSAQIVSPEIQRRSGW